MAVTPLAQQRFFRNEAYTWVEKLWDRKLQFLNPLAALQQGRIALVKSHGVLQQVLLKEAGKPWVQLLFDGRALGALLTPLHFHLVYVIFSLHF